MYELYAMINGEYQILEESDYKYCKAQFKKLKRMFLNEENSQYKIIASKKDSFSYQKRNGEIITIAVDYSTSDYNNF